MFRWNAGLYSLCLAAAVVATLTWGPLVHAEPAVAPDRLPTPDWATPKAFKEMTPHPRLYVSAAQLERAVKGRGESYAESYAQMEKAARTGLREADNPMPDVNALNRQNLIIGRLSAMALQYHRTGDKQYIEASVQTIENMKDWFQPEGLWQLWHGGFATAIAISYDLLHNDMTPDQRQRVEAFARDHVIRPFLQRTGRGHNMKEHGEHGSWWQNIISNWNPVCNAGAGLLALAMYEDLDEAQTVIDRVNASLDPIIKELQETRGGWAEGLGYWNWTVHYMSLFYMSYERATGTEHAGFRSPGFRQTLTFVDYFVPYDEACGFGDNLHGNISNSLLAAAEQMEDDQVLKALQHYERRKTQNAEQKQAIRERRPTREPAEQPADQPADQGESDADKPVNLSYGEVNRILIRPDSIIGDGPTEATRPMTRFYPKPGWGAMADQWPEPNIYVAFRAGQLGGPHTQQDLLTWFGAVGNEFMVRNINAGHVSQNAYAGRRNELYEVNSLSKNSLLVGGLQHVGDANANTTEYLLPTGPMALNEATKAYDTTRNRPSYVARAFLIIHDRGLLVLDRVIAPRGGGQPVEVRTFTPRSATFTENDVLLEGEFETARMTFASNVPSTLSRHAALMTFPVPNPPTMMRWQTNRSEPSTVMASLLTHGGDPVALTVDVEQTPAPDSDKMLDGPITITMKGKDWTESIRLTDRLEPIASERRVEP